jgi:hypothetical protein
MGGTLGNVKSVHCTQLAADKFQCKTVFDTGNVANGTYTDASGGGWKQNVNITHPGGNVKTTG